MSTEQQSYPNSATINGITVPATDVHMIRSSLGAAGLAEDADRQKSTDKQDSTGLGHALPVGYQIRTFQPGDEDAWLRIVRDAETFFRVEDTLFDVQFGGQIDHLHDRMFFIDYVGNDTNSAENHSGPVAIGTATAWWKAPWISGSEADSSQSDRGEWGQVHWVAVEPAHQGKGLTKPLMDQVMQRIAQSHSRAMLGTSPARVWAVKVYLDFGFVPDPAELTNPEIRTSWQQLQKVLQHPALISLQ